MSAQEPSLLTLILASAFVGVMVAAIYIARRRRLDPLFPRSVFLTIFVIYFVVLSLEGRAMALLFLWFSAILAVSSILDALLYFGVDVNEKLALAMMLATLSGLGLVVNLLMLWSSASLGAKVFALAILVAVHVPILIAIAAYAKGKRELSKSAMRYLYLSRRPSQGADSRSQQSQ